MDTDRQIDGLIGSWMEDTAPTHLPARALEATFERTRVSRQEVGWRGLGAMIQVPRATLVFGGLAMVTLGAALAVGAPQLTDDPRRPFLGTWVSTSDGDGGTQSMSVQSSTNDSVTILVLDDIASVCGGTRSTMTGTGTVDGDRLVIPTPDYRCDDGTEPQLLNGEATPLNGYLRGLTYVWDPARDVLTIGGTGVWVRAGAVLPTAEPTVESTSPESAAPATHSPPPPLTEAFDSPLHGISIAYPSGWQARPASEPWTGDEITFDSPAVDVIFDPELGDRLYLSIVSEPLGALSGDDWTSRAGYAATVCHGGGGGGITVDGAHAWCWHCGNTETFITTGTHGYVIQMVVSEDVPRLRETFDEDWYHSVLETVDLRPEEAASPPPATTPAVVSGITRRDGEVLRFRGGDLVAIDPKTAESRVLVDGLEAVVSAAWSADGRWIAYQIGRMAGDLWVVGSEGPPRRLLTNGARWTWSPDGARLAVVDEGWVSIVDAATGELTRLVATEWTPMWSPDGTGLVYGERGGAIYSVDVRTGERSLLVQLPGVDLDSVDLIEWSPDGARLAIYNDTVPGDGRLFVLDADGSDVRVLAEHTFVFGLDWAPDGTRLAVTDSSDSMLRIWVTPVDGGTTSLVGSHATQDFGGEPAWSPDGSQIAVRVGDSEALAVEADGSGGVTPIDALAYEAWSGGWFGCGPCAGQTPRVP